MENDKNTSRPPPEPARVRSKAKQPLASLVFNLFSTLSMNWRCAHICKRSHQAALALDTNRTYSEDDDASASFTVLLSSFESPTPVIRWLETGITVREPLFVLPIYDNSRPSF